MKYNYAELKAALDNTPNDTFINKARRRELQKMIVAAMNDRSDEQEAGDEND